MPSSADQGSGGEVLDFEVTFDLVDEFGYEERGWAGG
jgi:hypothetical protein